MVDPLAGLVAEVVGCTRHGELSRPATAIPPFEALEAVGVEIVARIEWLAVKALTQHSCYKGQTERLPFRSLGKGRSKGGRIWGQGARNDLNLRVIS
jgi:hypothetical protein